MVATKKYAEKLPPEFFQKLAKRPVPWGPLGYVTYKRTYSRLREDLGRTEEWHETVERCVNALLRYGMRLPRADAEVMAEYVYDLKCTPPGRMLWQLGTATVDRVGADSLLNCWFTNVDRPDAFCFAFDMLMLGGGVGFSVLPTAVHKLPPVKGPIEVRRVASHDVGFIVPDNREGWVELLRRVLDAFFVTGKGFTYSTACVRGKGERIKGFGGTASGPEELVRGINQIAGVLNARAGKHLRPVDALDVMNLIGSVVVAGNVRRSAQIALGAKDDVDFLAAKRWSRGDVPNWRAMSNNTVVTNSTESLGEEFWKGYAGDGESYGLFNLRLARALGRLADGPGHRPDPRVDGLNPCGEANLESRECCDLAELFLPRLKTAREFQNAARFMYLTCKTVLQLPLSWAESVEVVRRNQRIGVSVSGFCQQKHFGAREFSEVYKFLEGFDRAYSRQVRANPSVKLTTVKPSGTVSLLPGVTPGVHPAYARYYVRRIRFSASDPIVEACRKAGYPVEPQVGFDGTPDHDTQVVSFPVDAGEDTTLAKDLTAVDQLEHQKFLQTVWADQSVSATVYYRKEELPAIKGWLRENYRDSVKTSSFLLHSEHGFKQAPYEEISRAQYDDLKAKSRPVNVIEDARQWDVVDSLECAGGACPVK